jgi:5-methyltetrahydropteroyltriglutamate--homocysteine methyltransferase
VSVLATCLGYPRIGIRRELKKALESHWASKSSASDLEGVARELRRRHWTNMKRAGLDHVPSNDFSLYDHVLDMAVCLGAVPGRFAAIADPLARYFAMARGLQEPALGLDVRALEMTKWFDTNYHYLVPELELEQHFELDATKLTGEVEEARALGIETRPVILGPVSFLLLSKPAHESPGRTTLDLLEAVLPCYERLLGLLAERGVAWAQIDEPCLVQDLDERARSAYVAALTRLSARAKRPRLLLSTYFDGLGENRDIAVGSGFDALHVDLVRAPEQLEPLLAALGPRMLLSAGVVDGRNVWRTDLDAALAPIRRATEALGPERVWVAPSCSLLHVPADLTEENRLAPELKSWLSFAAQKLDELRLLADAATEPANESRFSEARAALSRRRSSPRTANPEVRRRVAEIDASMLRRSSGFEERAPKQRARLRLPTLPTTTIGSFPQTKDVRAARAAFRAGKMTDEDYAAYLRTETRLCIEKQEALDLDVLVHGEFERTDMVEYFGERLGGFAFTENGWVQSYGSRCVKPPVLFGDVWRPRPITVEWARYAQSLTKRPMKGMLTGPVTILKWSFVRDDQPLSATCLQVALALRDEVADLEGAGIGVIQVDEPALREGLPLRRAARKDYLRWAVDAFRLTTSGVRDETQIHTHMCYAEFGDILEDVAAMDADVLSIETSRSRLSLLDDFRRFRYPNDVGPGVYDIHSPRVPDAEEMLELILRAASVLPARRLWVNPDCGLKTRAWPEVEAALGAMIQAARLARERLAQSPP